MWLVFTPSFREGRQHARHNTPFLNYNTSKALVVVASPDSCSDGKGGRLAQNTDGFANAKTATHIVVSAKLVKNKMFLCESHSRF